MINEQRVQRWKGRSEATPLELCGSIPLHEFVCLIVATSPETTQIEPVSLVTLAKVARSFRTKLEFSTEQ